MSFSAHGVTSALNAATSLTRCGPPTAIDNGTWTHPLGTDRAGRDLLARILHGAGHEPTILDDDPDHVEQSRRFGFRVFYGDATRLELLEAAGAARADFLIIAMTTKELFCNKKQNNQPKKPTNR